MFLRRLSRYRSSPAATLGLLASSEMGDCGAEVVALRDNLGRLAAGGSIAVGGSVCSVEGVNGTVETERALV